MTSDFASLVRSPSLLDHTGAISELGTKLWSRQPKFVPRPLLYGENETQWFHSFFVFEIWKWRHSLFCNIYSIWKATLQFQMLNISTDIQQLVEYIKRKCFGFPMFLPAYWIQSTFKQRLWLKHVSCSMFKATVQHEAFNVSADTAQQLGEYIKRKVFLISVLLFGSDLAFINPWVMIFFVWFSLDTSVLVWLYINKFFFACRIQAEPKITWQAKPRTTAKTEGVECEYSVQKEVSGAPEESEKETHIEGKIIMSITRYISKTAITLKRKPTTKLKQPGDSFRVFPEWIIRFLSHVGCTE